jgi:hypothetical protein
MKSWTPLWSGIVESSLWEESGDVVKVFMTLLARKDFDHISRLTAYNIHKLCNIDEVKVLEILKILASPDSRRKEQQQFDGRRIKPVEDGWLILNGEKYRKMVSEEMRKNRLRKAQAAWRARNKSAENVTANSKTDNGMMAEEMSAHEEVQSAQRASYDAERNQRLAMEHLNSIQSQ